ncbi:cyclopropane-fatty-acyl-phospholipid synthase [Anopheles sinensis]|uniref:Cyclopropane-fatty-acyl-phospholipid synthase n=1 Tax=Anopheles sinensis TaxID=74873 RepID=A0A084VQM3_ANOSI|nr:cyclopropane-fatty-acyl-phospholipid synthase [Anopheles sinensis]
MNFHELVESAIAPLRSRRVDAKEVLVTALSHPITRSASTGQYRQRSERTLVVRLCGASDCECTFTERRGPGRCFVIGCLS